MEPSEASPSSQLVLSVVIIGRNEEEFIGGAIESALRTRDRIPEMEVIFVDSASTDRSVEIARRYPIRILQLRREWPLCVAAGRYTGYIHSQGRYVFFQDGDSTIEAEWLVKAVRFLEEHPKYGGVAGILDEEYLDPQGNRIGRVPNIFEQDPDRPVLDVKHLGGIALYRRRAMEVAGPVNPHLPTAEDHELCMRLRNAGFKLARLNGLMAIKFTENRQTIREVLRRTRTRMYDCGTVVRYAGLYGGAMQFCFEALPYVLSFVATILFFILATLVAFYLDLLWVVALMALLLAAALVIKKGSFYGALLSIAVRGAITYRTILSFFKTRIRSIEEYPNNVIVIQ